MDLEEGEAEGAGVDVAAELIVSVVGESAEF